MLDVTPQFYEAEPIKYEKLSLWYLFHYVRPYKKAMIQLIIGLLAGSLLQLVFPFLTQTIVDQGIGHRNLNFYTAHFGRTTHAGIQPHTY